MPRKTVPTKTIESEPNRSRGHSVLVALSVVIGIGLTIGAVLWGQSDTGQINVSATIVNSQTDGSQEGNAPTFNTSNELATMPNGGLVPQGEDTVLAPEPPPPPEPIATTTVSTTEETTDSATEGEQSSDTAVEPDGEEIQ